jgi:hypothetical protein
MSSITVDLEGFKKLVGEFCKAAPTAEIDSLENGIKCVGLSYFGIEPPPESGSYEEIIAVSYLQYAQRRYMEREVELAIGQTS